MSDKPTSPAELRDAFLAAVRPLPTTAGGSAIVVATAGPPPAVNLLSTGDISVADDTVRIAVFANNSLVAHLGGSCTILVPTDGYAVRVSLTGGGKDSGSASSHRGQHRLSAALG